MSALQSLLVNSIWVLGLSGLLATLSYMDWYRSVKQWTFLETLSRPRMLAPLYASLTCFCAGLCISEFVFSGPVPATTLIAIVGGLWKSIVWGGFAIYFTAYSCQAILFGRRHGWDTPIKH